MSREVIWTRRRFELMCEQGMLSDDDAKILEMHIRRASNLEIAMRMNCDISVICDAINRLKRIYDAVQKENPDILDIREKSVYKKKHNK